MCVCVCGSSINASGPYDEELIGRIMSEDIDNDAPPSPRRPRHPPAPPPAGPPPPSVQQQPEVTSPQPPSLPFSLQSTTSSRHSDDAHSDSRRPRYTLINAAPICPLPLLPLIRRFDIHPQMAGSHQSAEVAEMGAAVHTSGVMMGLTAASCGSASARGVTSMMGVM